MGNVHMEAAQINYRGGEKKMSVEEVLKSTSGEAAAIAQLQTDVANLRDVKANQITIAPTFSAETAYDPGDLVYYNGLSYRCVNAHEGEWDADDFAATTISNELASLMSGLTNLIKITNTPLDNSTLAPGGYTANACTISIPTGYTLAGFYIVPIGAYTSYCTFYTSVAGVIQATNTHQTETAVLNGVVVALFVKTAFLN